MTVARVDAIGGVSPNCPSVARLELPAAAYDAAPGMWWSRKRWVRHGLALYDAHYARLRREGAVPSVGRATWAAWLEAESRCADAGTGRGCRPTVRHLRGVMSASRATVQRCRRLAVLTGLRTVVFTGRRRTLAERMHCWRVGDAGRGWASVSALHESRMLPVHNPDPKTCSDQPFEAPLSHSDGSPQPQAEVDRTSLKDMSATRTPHGKPRRQPAYDPEAMATAAACRRDKRLPGWVRWMPRGMLAAVLTRYALAGWRSGDVFAALEEYRRAGNRLLDTPMNPPGYLAFVLGRIPPDMPPALLARARTVAAYEAERGAWQRERERMAAVRVAAADSPARAAAYAVAAAARGRATHRSNVQ